MLAAQCPGVCRLCAASGDGLYYSNPSNTRSDGRCCDSLNSEECSEWRRCDTYFIYCLLPRFSTATECPNTAPGFIAVSNVSSDGAYIDFSHAVTEECV